ncbi:MAG: hypothetical protein OEM82_10485 [Acidobacteriota bacterium]|nr:hypothetical protein [Acidobacteriota bacterium]MDH3528643.1 hypothetical protein [Acidobacteriota bacterium]
MKATEELETKTERVGDADNIDKIRDILFGVQVREFEQKISALETRFNLELKTIREETREQIEKLEQIVNKEISALTDEVQGEVNLRVDGLKAVSGEIARTSNELDEKFSKVNAVSAKNESEIRQIRDRSAELEGSIRKKLEEVVSAVDQETKEIRDQKADRAALADLFTEMAMRLAKEFADTQAEDNQDS